MVSRRSRHPVLQDDPSITTIGPSSPYYWVGGVHLIIWQIPIGMSPSQDIHISIC